MFKTIFMLAMLVYGTAAAAGNLDARLMINGSPDLHLSPGAPAVLELRFTRTDTGERVDDFVPMHMKPMHMVVIREDLGHFAHFHPAYDASTGLFTMPVHLPVRNPDNQDSERAMPEPGLYHVYAEVKSRTFGMRKFHFTVDARGRAEYRDPVPEGDADSAIVKYFDERGFASRGNGFYRLDFSIDRTRGCGGVLLKFRFRLRARDESGAYGDIETMQPWLMMGGHAILASEDSTSGEPTAFVHTHSELPGAGSTFVFSHFDRGHLPPGVYRMWAQFKHRDRVLTLPVTFTYGGAEARDCL